MRKVYYLYPALVLAVFLGIIQLSTLTPYWNTSARSVSTASSTVPSGELVPGGAAAPVLVDTADLKGTWTLADVAKTFQVPSDEIKAHFEVPVETPDSTAVKDLSKLSPGFETSQLRDWLKARSPVAKQ